MTSTTVLRRLVRSVAAAGIVIAFVVPAAVLAAEPDPLTGPSANAAQAPSATPTEPVPSAPPPTLVPGDPGDGQGEVVIDGPFVTPTPAGSVLDAVSEPRLTPPPTDAVTRTGPSAGVDTLWQLLISLAGLVAWALALGAIVGRDRGRHGRNAVRARAASPATRTTPGRRTRR